MCCREYRDSLCRGAFAAGCTREALECVRMNVRTPRDADDGCGCGCSCGCDCDCD